MNAQARQEVKVAVAQLIPNRQWLAHSKNLDLLLLASCSCLLALSCHTVIHTLLDVPPSDAPAIEQVRIK